MTELFSAQTLERAGLAAGLLASIWVNYKLVVGFNKTMQNHVVHATEAQTKLTGAIDRLIKLIEKKLR